ncbi:MAG: DUF2382 domain-containing protein [Ornithinibacter sp.]
MSIDQNSINDVVGSTVYGSDGDKIGQVGQVYLDDETGRPEWATVRTGLFGTSESFVPLSQSSLTGDGVTVPYDKSTVKDAPRVEADHGHLSQSEEAELYRHYGLEYRQRGTGTGNGDGTLGGGRAETGRVDRGAGHDTSGPNTDDAMTRSEERLNVGTQTQEAGRARLRKHVVTEQQTVNVPVTREEVTIDREPITEGNVGAAMDGPAISEEEHEVVLHEERPVVEKEAVPVERVRLGKETVTEQQQVTEEVRKEQIDADGVDEGRGSRR